MSGVVPARASRDVIERRRKVVHDLALAFIAPLRTYNHNRLHQPVTPTLYCRKIPASEEAGYSMARHMDSVVARVFRPGALSLALSEPFPGPFAKAVARANQPHNSAPLHTYGFTGRDFLYRGIPMLHAVCGEGKLRPPTGQTQFPTTSHDFGIVAIT